MATPSSSPPPPTRVIRTVDFELLPDHVADRMIQHGRWMSKHRSSLGRNIPFHRPAEAVVVLGTASSGRHPFQVIVHDFVGETHKSSNTDLFISGSHRHPAFFRELQRVLHGVPVDPSGLEPFTGLTMEWLNAVVAFLKHSVVQHNAALKATVLRDRLTAAEIAALPERFSAFTVPMDQSFVLVVDAGVLRRPCYHMQSRTVRWKSVYHCVRYDDVQEKPSLSDAWPVGVPQSARHHEATVATTVSAETKNMVPPLPQLWPHQLSAESRVPSGLADLLRDSLAQHGVVCVPLARAPLQPVTQATAQYLGRLMRLPTTSPTSLMDVSFVKDTLTQENETTLPWLYRHPKQFGSRHVNVLTGRTLYGHYCPALKRLLLDLEFLVRGAAVSVSSTLPNPTATTATRAATATANDITAPDLVNPNVWVTMVEILMQC